MNLFLISLSIIATTASPWDNLTANIAVVEYQPIKDPALTNNQIVTKNTEKYIEIIKGANDTNLDMIIFPEATLSNNIETAVEIEMDNPCKLNSYPQFVKQISCAARESQTYVIVNLIEKSKCGPNGNNRNCKNFGFYFYNTDVIFDRSGSIINRYRKYNLFGEFDLDKPKIAEQVTFGTDFGIKFGIFTCFDILFKSPAQDILSKEIDAIIYPSMWFSELPFLTALQTQQMWAFAHDIAFFGSGANAPSVGSGGSGIYKGSKGAVVEGFVAQGGSKTFIYRSKNGMVPPVPPQNVDILAKEMDNFEISSDHTVPEFNATILDTSVDNFHTEICSGDLKNRLCCNFTLRMSKLDLNPNLHSYSYFLVAFSGIRSFRGMYFGGIELCAIVACLDSSLSSCGKRFTHYEEIQWPLTFEEVTISANFEKNENKTQFPNSLLSSIRPIDTSETLWTKNEIEENGKKLIRRTFSLLKPQNRLFTFAIYGRDFGRDLPPILSEAASWVVTSFLLGCVVVLSILSI